MHTENLCIDLLGVHVYKIYRTWNGGHFESDQSNGGSLEQKLSLPKHLQHKIENLRCLGKKTKNGNKKVYISLNQNNEKNRPTEILNLSKC